MFKRVMTPTGGGEIDQNTDKSYSSQIADKLFAKSNVHDLRDFLDDSSAVMKKGDVLLYHLDYGEDITSSADLLSRLDKALENGAVLAFIDISAEEIDKFTDKLSLNLPNYLPEDATSEDKKEIEDFYSVAVRLDSEDESVENDYAYFGIDLVSGDKDSALTLWSGDQLIPINLDEYTVSTDVSYEYVDENGNLLSEDPRPANYDYVQNSVDDFMEWVAEMNEMKAVSEASPDTSVSGAAEEATTIFSGVSTTFKPYLYDLRWLTFNYGVLSKRTVKYGYWHRRTSMTFNILPVHRFSDGADFYVVRVTGSTDPSTQYAHPSYMSPWFRHNRIVDGMTRDKPGTLICDNVVGYNWTFQYKAYFEDGITKVGTVYNSAPSTMNNSTKVSKGFTFALDGNITGGISEKDGLKAEASIKPSWKWESKEEYTVNDYQCANISGGSVVGWKWEFQRPKDGPQGTNAVWLEDVPLSGRTSVNLKSEFVIMVSKQEWKKYPSFKLVTEFKSSEGGTEGGGATYFVGNVGRRDYSHDWSKTQKDYTLPRPPHIAVTQAKFNYKATASKGDTQVVTLQSEEDWKATASANWIHLTTSDNDTKTENGNETVSGKATGSGQAQIMIAVDPVTDGKSRGGKVVFRASDGETCVVNILQAGR
ncbi:MAG: leukocidin family pore-forming toxin [Synergistaceae bacterium]|nr:leukocidin family pore-forming toxin [Synergistaceae bacterium]